MGSSKLNLYYLYTAARLNIIDYRIYEKHLSNRKKTTNLGEREKGSLFYLVQLFLENNITINKLDNFYYSYTIPHIGKEFDLLKIDQQRVLSIELKSENVGLDRIKEQLICNYKYLKYLSKESHLFTFVSDSKTFYKLDENHNLINVNKEEVFKILDMFDSNYVEIDSLFRVSDYLVSPNVNPQKFINSHYFLTTQQEYIKAKLLNSLKQNNIFKITGDAGTGKTLLLFDIAREIALTDKVLIINCNKKNDGHDLIVDAFKNLTILSQNELILKEEELYYSDYIFIDEAQRITSVLWQMINKYITGFNKKFIFCLDPKQVLTKEEIKGNYSSAIDKLNPIKFKLSNRIRINNNIRDFTLRLFDLNSNNPLDLNNVNIHYASNSIELSNYFKIYENDYTYISIPNSNYNYGEINKVNISDVVGKDYDNVLMIIDHNYYYDNGKLRGYDSKKNDYLYLKILYQGLSRTKENITLIFYKNKKAFKELLKQINKPLR